LLISIGLVGMVTSIAIVRRRRDKKDEK
jgi:hypothetical protein